MDERISKLVDDATGGLADDPELRLDVRAELASHLERTAQAFQDEGKGADESVAEAVKVFGSPLEVAGELLEANARRMRLRALARLAVRALLIPAALVVALWVGYAGFIRLSHISSLMQNTSVVAAAGSVPNWSESQSTRLLIKTLFILNREQYTESLLNRIDTLSGLPKAHPNEKIPAIAFRHPERKEYLGYYASCQFNVSPESAKTGIRNDPDNGLYRYMLAHYYLSHALMVIAPSRRPAYKERITYRVEFPALLEQGLHELSAGMACPYLRSYRRAIWSERFSRLPPPVHYEDYLLRTVSADSELLPELASYRELSRKCIFIARYLIARGQPDTAKTPLLFSSRIAEQLAKDTESVIGMAVARSIAETGADDAALIARQIGRREWADQLGSTRDRFNRAILNGEDALSPVKLSPERIEELRRTGLMGCTISPIGGYDLAIRPQDLAPSRLLDYWWLDRTSISLLLALLLLVLLFLSMIWAVLFLTAGNARTSFLLLLPTWKMLAGAFTYGFLVPLGLYAIYTSIPTLSGREYNIIVNSNRTIIDHMLLIVVLLLFPGIQTIRSLKRRYRMLGIDISFDNSATLPRNVSYWPAFIFWLLVVAVGIWPLMHYLRVIDIGDAPTRTLAMLVVLGLFIALLSRGIRIAIRMNAAKAVYTGSLAGSLVSVYAIVVLLLALVTQPYLAYRERQLLAEDTVVFLHGNEVGFSAIDNRSVERIKTELFGRQEQSSSHP